MEPVSSSGDSESEPPDSVARSRGRESERVDSVSRCRGPKADSLDVVSAYRGWDWRSRDPDRESLRRNWTPGPRDECPLLRSNIPGR